jgi:hypothetical protein
MDRICSCCGKVIQDHDHWIEVNTLTIEFEVVTYKFCSYSCGKEKFADEPMMLEVVQEAERRFTSDSRAEAFTPKTDRSKVRLN